jgi:hypothetical protein
MRKTITVCLSLASFAAQLFGQDAFLKLDAKRAREIALSTRANGQVGKSLDFRIVATDRSYNYKLRATWMTPEVIRANARLIQINQRLTDARTKALVAEAEAGRGTVILVEIDPREGSGVIPRDWLALLQPNGSDAARSVTGANTPGLRDVQALASAARRDYSYDVFWVVFPLAAADGSPLFRASDREMELAVQIYDKTGKVRWSIPDSVREMAHRSQR